MVTSVVNLTTGDEQLFTLPPEQAVVAAHEQSQGNSNTWTYDYTKAEVSHSGRTVSCGDFCAVMPK